MINAFWAVTDVFSTDLVMVSASLVGPDKNASGLKEREIVIPAPTWRERERERE